MLVPASACGVDTVNAVLVVRRNVAVTDCAALIVTVQLLVPVQAPLHPTKLEPAAGVSVRLTLVPLGKFALHVPGQLIPVGVLATVPDPLPAIVTDSAKLTMLKVAVTDCAALIVTVQLPVPVQAPLHPAKLEPAAGVSVRVTLAPLTKVALQVLGQLIPGGVLVTVPDPLPASVTDRGGLKVAVTDWAALIVTVQLPVPVQPPPLHPAKVQPAAGVSVRVTLAPLAKFATQVPGQPIPGGLLETVPLPARATVSGNVVAPVQLGKLKLAMRVFQLNTPVVLMYSWVYQKVQSSTGSICMAL
jgi:dUTPase